MYKPKPKVTTCRYLDATGYCAYWDEQLHDRETIRCEGPGGWSEDCYVEDSRGCIWDGEWLTIAEFMKKVSEMKVPENWEQYVEDSTPEDAK